MACGVWFALQIAPGDVKGHTARLSGGAMGVTTRGAFSLIPAGVSHTHQDVSDTNQSVPDTESFRQIASFGTLSVSSTDQRVPGTVEGVSDTHQSVSDTESLTGQYGINEK